MKVEQINLLSYIKPYKTFSKKKHNEQKYNYEDTVFSYKPSFQGNLFKYVGAKNYLKEEVLTKIKNSKSNSIDLFKFDLDKLDGIQEGIKVFKNLSMKEIAFILTTISEFATIRGCHNNCSHCYGDAKPPIQENDIQTKGMLWEDFLALTSGIKELNKRLNFQASGQEFLNSERYLTTFHDSDCIETSIKDKLGNEHDFTELAKILYDTLGVKVIFDTAGWNITNKKAQNKAEKIVEYYKNSENREVLDQINISLNPFHAIHSKSVELRKENKIELANKLRDTYTTRMANVLYTFTPLHKSKKFNILSTFALSETSFEGFDYDILLSLTEETFDKLKEMYEKDYENEQKFIKSKKEIAKTISNLKKHISKPRLITLTEKAKRIFGENNQITKDIDAYIEKSVENLKKNTDKTVNTYRESFVGMIDSNGKYYLTNYYFTIPTEITLNFKNQKETAPIKPNLKEDLLITKDTVKKFSKL